MDILSMPYDKFLLKFQMGYFNKVEREVLFDIIKDFIDLNSEGCSECKDWETCCEDKEDEIDELKDEIHDLEKELDSKEQELDKLKDEFQSYKDHIQGCLV